MDKESPQTPKPKLTPYQRRAVAVAAVCHERTVRSWERGTARSTTVARVERAIRDLGLHHVLKGRTDA